jgi:hypothetical protein
MYFVFFFSPFFDVYSDQGVLNC